ncbi:MAG: FAD/NAD(P)-binding protein, partial [Proteobacteria bacterium]|nr:FAD/NAD(P)-binding protein [Pseudomonadota bacterium]
IVGGGLSGVAVAIHLLRRGAADLRITIVERGPWLGRGVAYGCDSEVFRLNVPASRMSVDPAKPDDFVRWAGVEATPTAFLPRTLYGRYVVERFREALRASPAKLRIVRGEVTEVDATAVRLVDGTVVPAEVVVLATGLAPRLVPSMLAADPRIIDAWDECALAALPRTGRLLILGSGLTALDVIGFLAVHDFRGTASIVSRRGLLPRPHAGPGGTVVPLDEALVADAPRDLRGLIRWGRAVVESTTARGAPWQLGIDAIRPHFTRLWRTLPPADRARFVRSVRPYWDVLRHRAPLDTHALVERWRREGRLEQVAGSLARCQPTAAELDCELRLAGGAASRRSYDAIVRCIGPALDRADADAPVIHDLIAHGGAAADPAGLGIVTDEVGRVIGRDGVPSDRMFALGALRRASSWETTAVPEIAVHALAL